jgi:hypothetical protein
MAEWTRNTPWRQGNLLPSSAIAELGLCENSNPAEAIVVVASHDCDLAQDPQSEPNVEVVFGAVISTPDGNNTHAKNARKLHLRCSGNTEKFAEFIATNKIKIPKSLLASYVPNSDFYLNVENKNILQRWLASRYRRSAFPDEFESRLKNTGLADKIAKAVRSCAESITAIFFDVDEGNEIIRSVPSDVYVLDIYILYCELPTFEAAEALANEVKDKISLAFSQKNFDQKNDSWQYIELRYVEVISEQSLTYHQSKYLKQWRLEHISFAADPQQSIMAE